MEVSKWQKIVDDLLEKGQKKGDGEVLLTAGKQFQLQASGEKISDTKYSTHHCIGYRAFCGDKMGLSYTESLAPKALEELIGQAHENAKYSDPSTDNHLQASGAQIIESEKEIFLPDSSSLEDKKQLALKLESDVLAHGPHVKAAPYNQLGQNDFLFMVANTNGTQCSRRSRSFSCYTSALMEKDGTKVMFAAQANSRQLKELDIDYCVQTSLQRGEKALTGRPLKTGQYDVVFSTEVFKSLFSAFQMVFSAKAAKMKTNPWEKSLGQMVADPRLTLADCPQYEPGMLFSTFDCEGYPMEKLPLIEKGKLLCFAHNSQTAQYFKAKNNARAMRTPKSQLGVGLHQVVISAGPDSDVFSSGDVFYVMDLQGLHSGTNPISGDFSCGAQGVLFKKGEESHAVKDVTLSGNFYSMLKEIEAIDGEIRPNETRDFFAPDIRFKKLSVAGP